MGNGVGMGIVNLCKKLHAAWAEMRELLIEILFKIHAHVDLIHEQRSVTMNFEFHLPFGSLNTAVNALLDRYRYEYICPL